jgi:tetratricopeptide (TPR) repeat protein
MTRDPVDNSMDDIMKEVVDDVRSEPVRLSSARAARQRQAIADAIVAEHRRRQRALSPAAAALLAIGVAGVAIAGTLVALSPSQKAALSAPATTAPPTTTTATTATVLASPQAPAGDVNDDVGDDLATVDGGVGGVGADDNHGVPAANAGARPRTVTPPVPEASPPPTTDALVAAALDGGRGDVLRLGQRFAEMPVAVDDALAVAAHDDGQGGTRARRLRCELQLRFGRSPAALELCRTYLRVDSDDDGARPLAFGAGGLAEELGLLDDATAFYTRAIMLSPLSGATSVDALKARARVHARAGRVDDARADLRLFIEARSAAALDDDVIGLATRLGMDLSR